MTPADFEKNYKSFWGAGFSIAPLFSQSAYFRFRNQDPKIDNLFFVGAGTHPGAGLPGVVSSAKVTDVLVDGYLKKNPSRVLVETA
jgi:phytoene desaturase